uniref:HDC07531 n=1 Tax=Drosophila melanogaster TaxID=7227 RepID=Q6IM42_DROME|nr:TPA_inf: HDC07531 [Drosophila melanogaster]
MWALLIDIRIDAGAMAKELDEIVDRRQLQVARASCTTNAATQVQLWHVWSNLKLDFPSEVNGKAKRI